MKTVYQKSSSFFPFKNTSQFFQHHLQFLPEGRLPFTVLCDKTAENHRGQFFLSEKYTFFIFCYFLYILYNFLVQTFFILYNKESFEHVVELK